MKIKTIQKLMLGLLLACAHGASLHAQVAVPGTFKHITIDGSFSDWSGVPLAYTAVEGDTNAITYQNIYIANDQTNLYIRFTLYTPRAAFQNSYDNLFIDADDNSGSGFAVGGIGSEMLVQWGGGYQETNGAFTSGAINNLGWNLAASGDNLDYELSVSLESTYNTGGALVFTNPTVAILLEGDNTSYINTAFAPTSGGFVYTFASAPSESATNSTLIDLANSSWEVNGSGTDLGTNWLAQDYDDTVSGWSTGDGLFGYTTSPSSYPPIATPLTSGPSTYYFRTHFSWTNDTANIAFVVTNYMSDGAVYYLNGTEIKRLRMPGGAVSYSTAASATNSPVGHPDVFGIDGNILLIGDNILEVEAHQAVGSSADLVFGLSLTAASQYPVLNVETNLPANQGTLAGQSITFTTDIIGSGPLVYQWYFDGTNAIIGANASSYTIPEVLNGNAGTYTLVVSNQFNAVTTRAALLTVTNTPVIITSQPASTYVVEGRSAAFTVGVTGTPAIGYQWMLGASPIFGATNSTYTLSDSLPANAGSYSVIVSNAANTTNSIAASLTVLLDTIPPALTNILAGSSQVTVTFSEPVDSVTSAQAAKYSISGESVVSAVQNPGNSAQVTLTVSPALTFGPVYTLTINGVKDLFGNASHAVGQFARDITIDGSFDDWTGLSPIYTNATPSGITNAADFEYIYAYNDADYYYLRVTLWADIDPNYGQFPYYVNMFIDTDNNPSTGYLSFGSDLLIQSGYSYQEKDGTFNDGYPIKGLNFLSLPASPGTNFEFRMSRLATFSENNALVFSANAINFLFQSYTAGFAAFGTQAPVAGGVISYTNVTPASVAPLPLGKVAIATLPSGQAALTWDLPGSLQESASLAPAAWTNVPSATSPYIVPVSSGRHFFRLTQ